MSITDQLAQNPARGQDKNKQPRFRDRPTERRSSDRDQRITAYAKPPVLGPRRARPIDRSTRERPRDRRSSDGRRVERITVHARPPASDPLRSVLRRRSDGQRECASSVESPKVTDEKPDQAIEAREPTRNGQSGQRRRYQRAIPAGQRGLSPAGEPSGLPRHRELGTQRAPHGAESALSR